MHQKSLSSPRRSLLGLSILKFIVGIITDELVLNGNNSSIYAQYVTADALHSSINGEYIFDPVNVTVGPIQIENLVELDFPCNVPAMSFRVLDITHSFNDANVNVIVDRPIQIFPNPFSSKLNFVSDNSSPHEFEIFKQFGQLIHQDHFHNELSLSMSEYATGLYYVHIIGQEGSWIEKVAKK